MRSVYFILKPSPFLSLALAVTASMFFSASAAAQAPVELPGAATTTTKSAPLHQVAIEGFKSLTEPAIVALTQLQVGAQVTRDDLQSGADHLLQTGLFTNVAFNFKTHPEGVIVTYRIEEAPRLPVYFDNFPWVADSEINDALRAKFPFYDGRLPTEGSTVDQASQIIATLLIAHTVNASIEHQSIPSPLGEGDVLEFHAEGAAVQIASITFSDPALAASKAIQQHLSEIEGKEYSRTAIDLFLAEQIRPFYLKQGFLRVKLGPPEIRLAGNPNQKLPDHLPIFVPVITGSPYQWKGAVWHGNEMLSEFALNSLLGEKADATADGEELEAGWDRIREQYGKKGYLEAKIDAKPTYDDAARTIAYAVSIEEGPAYHFGKLVLTGLSMEGEKRLTQAWPIQQGVLFDKSVFEEFISKLDTHPTKVFGDLPLHYEGVGHYLQTDPQQKTVDVLLDFKH